MMLCYKAWRESQTRFVLSALTIAGLCALFVLFQGDARAGFDGEPLTYAGYIWRIIYKGYLRELYVFLVLLLGVGGLLRESDYGTSGFTLALPVSRWRLVLARALIGLSEVAILAVLPALVIPVLSPFVHESYPWTQAIQFSLLWTVGGTLVFAMAFLSSVVFGGEYSAPVVALVVLLAYSAIADLPALDRFDVHDMMSGTGTSYFRLDTALITGPLPWMAIAVVLLVSCCMVVLAGRITQAQDL
jgi:ABC-2 type transport system permease protein